MPARNAIKEYIPDTYYHIYNRGVEKRKIFLDEQDYGVFLSYLKNLLSVPKTKNRSILDNNFSSEVTLLSYCLMSNHFHLLIKQKDAQAIGRMIKALCTRYSMYFNKKYDRVGKLF
jgi:putative transposase